MKFGLILPAGDHSIDAGDFLGTTEVFLDEKKFVDRIAELFARYLEVDTVEGISIAQLSEIEGWEEFIETTWIDDRFRVE